MIIFPIIISLRMIVLYWLIGKEMVLLIVGFLLLFAFWSEPLDAHMR